jgi:hypothetical protein
MPMAKCDTNEIPSAMTGKTAGFDDYCANRRCCRSGNQKRATAFYSRY